MLSNFFLNRPVFAWVIAIVLMVLGCLSIHNLPISQYPNIAPPSIAIAASYPGASAETVENSVTQIIEQKMTGFDDLLYLSSTSDSSGSARIELTFKAGTDPDLAWAKVQNKLQLAQTSLPSSVQQAGVSVNKSTTNYLLMVGLISEDGSMNGNDLDDYAQSKLEKVLARIPGVGEVDIFGTQYAMRIWVNPEALINYSLTFGDIIQALRSYNVEVSAGQFGALPTVKGQRLNASIVVHNLLKTPKEFGEVPIRTNPDGSVVLLQDVARLELGAESYNVKTYYNDGCPSSALAIRQAPGANALETAAAVKAKMAEMSRYFPHGMKVVYPYDTTPFIQVAIHEVVKTLIEAIVLVFLVMYVFMGNIRATLIPTIAVPVVLLGTFATLSLFGFSINMLTMFAMVLAIGLLVDDAIVVVENVERIMSEEGLSPREATSKSMTEITSALIGIGLVLSAVFGPMAFFPGSTGIIYRQFSVTVIASMQLSVVVALILTPVLCATFLKPVPKGHEPAENSVFFLRWFFLGFDRIFYWLRDRYLRLVGYSIGRKLRFLFLYGLLVAIVGYMYWRLPSSYLPNEDQGIIMCQVALPVGSTMEMTENIANLASRHFWETEKEAVESSMAIVGWGFSGMSQNSAMIFVRLKDWELRQRSDLKSDAVTSRAMTAFFTDPRYRDAMVYAFEVPAVSELGNASVDFQLIDRAGHGHKALTEAKNQLIATAQKDDRLTNVRANGLEDVPEYHVDVDWKRAGALGIPIDDIHTTISAAFGSEYVNNFVQNARIKKVFVQADARYRTAPEDLNKLYVRNNAGKMAPYASFASGRWTYNSPRLERFNGFPSLNIWAEAAPGRSSGEAMQAMEKLVPEGFGYDWTGLSYQERMATSQGPMLYAFSILVIFLCVAALYESWTIPFVNLLMLPLGVLGALAATSLRGLSNDVYFQIGFLTTLGLSTKNAILIIQFIKEQQRQGKGLIDATLAAVKIRFRPVIMTSLAFFFGTLPLATATGAGAGAMNAIGTAVTGGMLSATFIDLIFIPLFFVVVCSFFGKKVQSPKVLPVPVIGNAN